MSAPPTDRQVEVLKAIHRSTRARGFPPTIRELTDLLGLRSNQGTVEHIERLEARGLVCRTANTSRSLVLTAAGRRAAGVRSAEKDTPWEELELARVAP